MAYSHIAHDCILGNNVIMANAATLGGHIAVHQFVRIGKFAFVGGCSGVSQDVLPFSRIAGDRAITYGVNSIGLRRAGFSIETISILKKAYRLIYTVGLPRKEALKTIEKEYGHLKEIDYLTNFIRSSKRGICKNSR